MFHLLFFFSASRYGALLIPASPGAVSDLAHNQDLTQILNHFIVEKSKYTVADPGIPEGGYQLPIWLRFTKCVCQNERIGTLGGHVPGAPPGSTNVTVVLNE